MDINTYLFAEIAQNLKNLQLQLDYEREKIITALGGEPALYDVTGIGALTATTAKIGAGSAIAGAALQVDGSLVIGDGAGGTKTKMGSDGANIPAITSFGCTLVDDAISEFTPSVLAGFFICSEVQALSGNNAIIASYYLTGSHQELKDIYQKSTSWEVKEGIDLTVLNNTTDGKIGVSSYGDKIQIRNRQGNIRYFQMLIIGGN